jgi:hypothetical protein
VSEVLVRLAQPQDEAFIYQTWCKGYLFGNPLNRGMDIQTMRRGYGPVIEALLKRSTTRILCLPDAQDVILGYSVFEPNRVHWIHIKAAFRGFKYTKLLLPNDFESVSHKTLVGEKILRKHFPKIKYNPFL